MSNSKAGCSAGIFVAIAVFVILLFAFKNFIWWFLGISAVLIILAAILLFNYNKKNKKDKEALVAEGVTKGAVDSYLAQSSARLQSIRRNYYKIKDEDMRREIDLLTDRYKQIAKIVKDDPADFKPARRFVDTMLSSMDRIVNQSVQIFNSPEISPSGREALDKALESLVLLRNAADRQISRFNENNILELDVELEVLKKSLVSRGLLKENEINSDESKGAENEQ